jgi:2-polyprenyl-6-methoxyphenol hydroxylase-like FAD-dependent oxidoreductase
MAARHAEIAGAGIAGLIAAAALAKRGWSVCVHERASDLRAFGSGVTCWNNFARVLEAVGALGVIKANAHDIVCRETRDRDNRVLYSFEQSVSRGDVSFTLTRGDLLSGLAAVAQTMGVEIRTSSHVFSADASGSLRLASGERRRADLVIAADGVNSVIRDGLDLLKTRRTLGEGSIRLLFPRAVDPRPDADREKDIEYWSGTRRLFCALCNPTELYLSMLTRNSDARGSAVPIDTAAWTRSFPHLESLIAQTAGKGRWDKFEEIKLWTWSRGKVAIVGDAATAMAPNIGQGGGTAAMNALSLAVYVSSDMPVEQAMTEWERRERPLSERTQSISYWYGKLNDLPEALRHRLIKLSIRSAWSIRLRQQTANHIPTGC